jgi:hypothetical protein
MVPEQMLADHRKFTECRLCRDRSLQTGFVFLGKQHSYGNGDFLSETRRSEPRINAGLQSRRPSTPYTNRIDF